MASEVKLLSLLKPFNKIIIMQFFQKPLGNDWRKNFKQNQSDFAKQNSMKFLDDVDFNQLQLFPIDFWDIL